MKRDDRAYLAGILDGEGSISLCRQKQGGERRTPMYQLSVQVVNRNEELIYWLVENLGGRKSSRARGGNRALIHEWNIYGRSCQPVLDAALPYLKVKRLHAELALDFIETLSPDGTRIAFLSDEVLGHRDFLVSECRALNERGAGN